MNKFKDILKLCRKYNAFLVVSHHNPDADAVASTLAMALFLKALGKKVHVLNEDDVPDWLSFLPQTKLFKKAAKIKPFQYDAAIVLDCGDLERIGGVNKLLIKGKPIVNIDHHVTNDAFGEVNLIMNKASSTCEVLVQLFKAGRVPLNKTLAQLLYAGIMTDTGSFRYENTSAMTHAIAAELMAFGVDAQDMYQRLYIGIPVNDMKLFTDVIHGAQLLIKNQVYCVALSKKTTEGFSKKFDLKEKLFGFLRMVEGIKVVVILTEVSPIETRINFRSQGNFNVAELAQVFNGGGHVKAAGGKSFENITLTQTKILSAIAKRLKK